MSEKYPINLGRKSGSMMAVVSAPEKDNEDDTHYPTLFLEWEKPYDLPDEGVATIRFKVCRRTEDEKHKRYSVELDVTDLLSVKSDKPKTSEVKDREDNLDKLRSEAEKEDESY